MGQGAAGGWAGRAGWEKGPEITSNPREADGWDLGRPFPRNQWETVCVCWRLSRVTGSVVSGAGPAALAVGTCVPASRRLSQGSVETLGRLLLIVHTQHPLPTGASLEGGCPPWLSVCGILRDVPRPGRPRDLCTTIPHADLGFAPTALSRAHSLSLASWGLQAVHPAGLPECLLPAGSGKETARRVAAQGPLAEVWAELREPAQETDLARELVTAEATVEAVAALGLKGQMRAWLLDRGVWSCEGLCHQRCGMRHRPGGEKDHALQAWLAPLVG